MDGEQKTILWIVLTIATFMSILVISVSVTAAVQADINRTHPLPHPEVTCNF